MPSSGSSAKKERPSLQSTSVLKIRTVVETTPSADTSVVLRAWHIFGFLGAPPFRRRRVLAFSKSCCFFVRFFVVTVRRNAYLTNRLSSFT